MRCLILGLGLGLWLAACGGLEAVEDAPATISARDGGSGGPDAARPGPDATTTPSAGDASAPTDAPTDARDGAPEAGPCNPPPQTDPCDCRAGAASCSSTDECAPLASCASPFRYDPGACFQDFRLSGVENCAPSSDGAAICCASFF